MARHFEKLIGISVEEQEQLRQSLRQSRGLLLVLVHPFYESFTEETRISSMGVSSTIVEERIARALRNKSANHLPVLILEEERNVQKTKDRIGVNASLRALHYIRTLPQSGTPMIAHELGSEKAWRVTSEFLRYVGVQKVYIGGQYRRELVGCVNVVIGGLRSHGISIVEMPGLEFPGARKLRTPSTQK